VLVEQSVMKQTEYDQKRYLRRRAHGPDIGASKLARELIRAG
jgi:hypothetical protein